MSIWDACMDTYYIEPYEEKPVYVLFKSKKHESFKIAEIIWSDGTSVGVKEYIGFSEYSHTIQRDDIFTMSEDIGKLNLMLRHYEQMIKFEEKKFGCVKILLEI